MSALTQNLFRIEIELADELGRLVNLKTGNGLVLPRSRELCFELVILKYGALDPDVTNISSIVAEVKTYQSPTSAPIISVNTATITAITDDQRSSKTGAHATLVMTQGMTGVDMTGADAGGYKSFDLVITATRSGKLVTLAKGTIQFLNDGGQYSGNTPTAGDPTYYTAAQIDGMIADFIKKLNPPGVATEFVSPSGQYKRRTGGVDDNGDPTDLITKLF